MQENKAVKPELVGGTRDMLPADAFAQQFVFSTVQRVYESFGFVPLDTPCMERRSVLTGDDPNFNKSIFSVRVVRGVENKDESLSLLGDDDVALRFDLTVSLARVVAAYPELPKPFKRYQYGKVFRGEQPQAGRFREFYQFDFDIIGSRSILADTEVVQVMYETMKALGVPRFVVRFNTRKVLNGLAQACGCTGKSKEVFRIIDKFDKIGLDGVLEELQRKPANIFDESAVSMDEAGLELVTRFLRIEPGKSSEVLAGVKKVLGGKSEFADEGIKELQEICQGLLFLGIPEDFWRVDLSVARGLDYYTGPVFETYLTDLSELGSVFSGGRFDGLANRFMPGSNIPGVGASVGIDRLIVGMQKLGLLKSNESKTKVLVTVFGKETENCSLSFSGRLRQAGVDTEIYLGDGYTLRAQIAYAAKKGIPYVVIIGPDESSSEKVQLKDMTARKQQLLTQEECINILK